MKNILYRYTFPQVFRVASVLGIGLSLAILSGCNTGMEQVAQSESPPIAMSTNRVRLVQNGDTWLYNIRSRFTQNGTSDFSVWEGTRRNFVTAVNDPVHGDLLGFNFAVERTIVDGLGIGTTEVANLQERFVPISDTQMKWVARQIGNTVYYIVDPVDGFVSNPDVFTDVGDSWSTGTIEFDDGSVLTHSQVVVGREAVTVPLGRFEAFKIDFTATASSGGQSTTEVGSWWFVPAIGAEVRLELTRNLTLSTGARGTEVLVAELVSTNVPF